MARPDPVLLRLNAKFLQLFAFEWPAASRGHVDVGAVQPGIASAIAFMTVARALQGGRLR
jgi:hypothetical protein